MPKIKGEEKMNEAETRAELIDPQLRESGWGVVDGSKILREYHIAPGKILVGGLHGKPAIADYVLVYHGKKIAIVEAKKRDDEVGEGVAQAKEYADRLQIQTTFASNGHEIYQICMKTGVESLVTNFPTPDQLWQKIFSIQESKNNWLDKFDQIPFEITGAKTLRYYQEIAVNNTLKAIAENRQRILLTLATGTGKTFIAFQIAWKLFQSRWNLNRDGSRRPRILFLADRNVLANQAFNGFSAFPEDALVRIIPKEIKKQGGVPTNGSIFFTIFQTFMSGKNNEPCFGKYTPDYFDFIIIDECHRGGANDEGNWRAILDYFSPAVQLGLTATPKRRDNVDTYNYFGEPLYTYSLKQGINDGFLTPFKVKLMRSTLDEYIYTSDDTIIEGEVEESRIYQEADFNKIIEIKEREVQHMVSTLYFDLNGKPMSAQEFLESLYGKLPTFFKNEDELRKIWSAPNTRKELLQQLENAGFERDKLLALQNSIDAENSDLFDVLEYVSFSVRPISRDRRVAMAQAKIFSSLDDNQKEFVEFVLSQYIESGVEELDEEKFPKLIELKYHTFHDAMELLSDLSNIKKTFMHFQQYLYEQGMM